VTEISGLAEEPMSAGGAGEAVASLGAALGERLVSVTVYGGHATEAPHHREPLRLCIELDPCDAAALEAAGGAIGARSARVRPYFVARGELARLADVFPLRIHGMLAHRRTIHGADPLAGVEIEREHLRMGVEQGLRNHLVRLRTHVALRGADAAASQAALLGVAEGIDDEASALGALGALVGAVEVLPPGVVERLERLRDGERGDESLLVDVLAWLERAVDAVDRMG
jgi:hypothetical protein